MSIPKTKADLTLDVGIVIRRRVLGRPWVRSWRHQPQNLLGAQDHLRLIDFDHLPRIGDTLDVSYGPHVRQRREFSGGVYGIAGPGTEQFANKVRSRKTTNPDVGRLDGGNFPRTSSKRLWRIFAGIVCSRFSDNPIWRIIANRVCFRSHL
jgi:hypothetical protein